MDELFEKVMGFGRELRHEGLAVGTGRILEFCQAASLLGPGDLYWVGRATLVSRQAEIPVYDQVFHRYWSGNLGTPVNQLTQVVERVRAEGGDDDDENHERGRETNPGSPTASRLELLRQKSFSRLTRAELIELARLVGQIERRMPTRRSRRREPTRRGSPDVRRTVRRSFRTGGEPLSRAWRDRRRKRRRIVLIVDVSGSMASYSRGLVVFAYAALRADSHWEAFCFGTRLTRLTKALVATTDPDKALERAAAEVNDWDGGTRIGDSLKCFLDRFGHGGTARGAVVIVCSDGLEVGDPVVLEQQMQRMSRLAYRIVWVNPLQEQVGYQPLARGMAAALPYVDVFASGHNMACLEALADELADL
jgi:uncharacterized protein with von Willebrand factor type A (vWA) domain